VRIINRRSELRADMMKQNGDRRIARRWLLKSLLGSVFLASVLFLSAGTARWPMAWALIALFAGVTIATYTLVDPALIAERERHRRSTERWDNVLLSVYGIITMLVVPVVAGLDKRFGWSPPLVWQFAALALLINIAGWALHIWAMRANAYFAIVVRLQQERGQTVATGGPYRWVRHPGYVGGIGFNLATPIMLGSLWALVPGILGAGLLVVRTALEDRVLHERLAGYPAYAEKVRYRLIPGVW
jgi:protein-S-isoprenylcysteine O-methyltransferase Ste14